MVLLGTSPPYNVSGQRLSDGRWRGRRAVKNRFFLVFFFLKSPNKQKTKKNRAQFDFKSPSLSGLKLNRHLGAHSEQGTALSAITFRDRYRKSKTSY
jgi:hypothetical protein